MTNFSNLCAIEYSQIWPCPIVLKQIFLIRWQEYWFHLKNALEFNLILSKICLRFKFATD